MPLSHWVAKGATLIASAGMALLFARLGLLGITKKRLPMRVGEVRGAGAIALGVAYLGIGGWFLWFGIAISMTPIR